jgi:hypothetical protein
MRSRDLVTVILLLDRDISVTQRLRLDTIREFPGGMRDQVHFSDDPIDVRLTLNAIFVDFVRWKMPEVKLAGIDFALNLHSIVEAGQGLRLAEVLFHFDHQERNFFSIKFDDDSWMVLMGAEIAPQRTALLEVQLRTMDVSFFAIDKEWNLVTAFCAIREPNDMGLDTGPFIEWIVEGTVDDVRAFFDAVNKARILVEDSPFPFSLSDLVKFIADGGKFSRSALKGRRRCEDGGAVEKGQDQWLLWLIRAGVWESGEVVFNEDVRAAAARFTEEGIFLAN